MRLRWTSVVLFCLCIGNSPIWADEFTCLQEIKWVCAGLENALEACVAERGEQLSAPCRDLINTSKSTIDSNPGMSACLADIKQACPNLTADALAQCLAEKKSSFSKACLDCLDSAPIRSDKK